MKLNLKEKIFNLLAQKFFGLNYNFLEAKDFNLTKELENNSKNTPYKKDSISITSKVLDNNKIIKFSNDFNIYACGTEKFETSEKIGVWEYYYKNEIENKVLYKFIFLEDDTLISSFTSTNAVLALLKSSFQYLILSFKKKLYKDLKIFFIL